MLVLMVALINAPDTIAIRVDAEVYTKRYVLRVPDDWNGKLVVGAHGGSGGEAFARDGRVIGTDETALDDVIGNYALGRGFAYASLDRDGVGGTREGLRLTKAFTEEVRSRLGSVEHTYLVGLSMGGGIARYAAEQEPADYDGVLIVAGAHGDAAARAARQARIAQIWPLEDEADVTAYAKAVGTPVEARRFWPFIGASTASPGSSGAGSEATSGRLRVPVIEVVGSYDDFVLPEVLAYKKKVQERGLLERHRLYTVEGAWHISRDDDAIASFQYFGSRMGLDEASIEAMATGTSYLATVHEALDLLDRWVAEGTAPPPDLTVREGQSLAP